VFDLSAYLGGFEDQEDHAVLTVTFLDRDGKKLGEAQVGPVTALERKKTTGLLLRSTRGKVPAGVRKLVIRLTFTRFSGSDNDGSADNLSLVFTEAPVWRGGGPVGRHRNGYFEKRGGKKWFEEVFADVERGVKGTYHFVEHRRTPDLVELHDDGRACIVR